MFAVIKTGGKQYKVAKDDVIKVEKIDGEAGSVVLFDRVLMVGEQGKITVGDPYVGNVKVAAEVLEQKKDKKVIIFKKKRRQHYRRTKGHRQEVTYVRIQDIGENLKAVKAAPKKAEEKKEAVKPVPEKEEASKMAAKKAPAKKPAAESEPKKSEAKKPAAKKLAAKKTPASKSSKKKED